MRRVPSCRVIWGDNGTGAVQALDEAVEEGERGRKGDLFAGLLVAGGSKEGVVS